MSEVIESVGCHGIPEAAYIHVPFCVSKCHYCDFNSYAGLNDLFDDYVNAVVAEIKWVADEVGEGCVSPLGSIYFGGGTPTILSADQLAHVLEALDSSMGMLEDSEVTVEANPGTVDQYKLAQLKDRKFNRLSLGVQSFDDGFLSRIGRAHTAKQAEAAFYLARSAGFGNIGLDLIFALPGQTIDHWRATLYKAVDLFPEHISLYELSIEEGTRFAELCAGGELDLPNEETQLTMYELAIETLKTTGYEHYEVSNFARPGYRSRHNSVYWRNDPYYGFGAGATSYVRGVRARRIADPRVYIKRAVLGQSTVEYSEQLCGRAYLVETLMLGLRVLDGISMDNFKAKTGTDLCSEFSDEIARLKARGLLEVTDDRVKVTHDGLLLLNDVVAEFVSE